MNSTKINLTISPDIIILVLLVLGSLAISLINLDIKPYWIDEVYTSLRLSGSTKIEILQYLGTVSHRISELETYRCLQPQKTLNDTLYGLITDDVHPPLYFVLIWLWAKLGGCGVGYLRSLSILFNIGSLITVYYLGRNLFLSRKTSLIGVGLISISPIYYIYAQEARSYSLLFLMSSLSSLCLLNFVKNPNKKNTFLYAITTILGLYCHTLYLLVVASQCFYIFILNKVEPLSQWHRIKISYILSILSSLACFILWLLIVAIVQAKSDQGIVITIGADYTWEPLSFNLFLHKLSLSLSSIFFDTFEATKNIILVSTKNISFSNLPISQYMNVLFSVGIVSFGGWAIYCSHQPRILIFYFSLMLPFILFFIKDLILGGYASTIMRYHLPTILAIYLSIAYGINRWLKNKKSKIKFVASILILSILVSVQSASWLSFIKAETWWSKGEYMYLPELTTLIQDTNSPFLIMDYHPQSVIELLTISYPLKNNLLFQFLDPSNLDWVSNSLIPDFQKNSSNYSYLLFSPSRELKELFENLPSIHLSSIHETLELYRLTFQK